ncbi:MAG: hypothetical protein A2268_08085 [Candidatus Raymondbacteria bacterium RifOxyA12_full_50_37]|uniref:histidine kinase n=1 Tax=Candidatus Raymondbacteria bacterium RIFOXYD12_FULL_49_13 TaxID=1817890 RepID=A0A1F7F136_UNCRA|nr:MAG: hypothetical protein A2268_08085 [Candidatus Raymondbacteria bacterium RifOxyA12_full_50_37]OGJ93320.1 MAG: hypothetical protein A2487_06850 [Candidatus Raymondbacteria bacterium RifOxyC12_full_50_8]OGJ93526.1 MAG: hypothetical protein A2248_09130 [Candidatus Raymondbacteria bacterium RIFOXYA2_FULL_49_16]OGJ98796.1 MAG: hypothetical protein A2453_09940 [Candidatus Raymondbacteria bacterium RIFOXYC2_FULL_50_21]OGK00341.1 MAG: hypothetical protein A2519_01100 [Candidatus Raymondbacteria b
MVRFLHHLSFRMRKSINTRFTLIFFILFGGLFVAGGVLINRYLQKEMGDLLAKRMISLSQSISSELSGVYAEYLLESDPKSRFLQTVTAKLKEKKEIFSLTELTILTMDARVIVSTNPGKNSQEPYRSPGLRKVFPGGDMQRNKIFTTSLYNVHDAPCMSVFLPLNNQTGAARAVLVVEASADYFKILRQIQRSFYVAGVVLIILLLLSSYLITRYITHPIRSLEKTAAQIGAGGLGMRSSIDREDEIGNLARSLNRMSAQLQSDRTQLDAKIASLMILAGGVAHEIRNPLNGINLYIDLMERKTNDPKFTEILKKIKNEIKLIEFIIAQLLDYTRPVELKYEPVPIQYLFDRVRAYCAQAKINASIAPGLNIWVDSVKFIQVLTNVLQNAVDAAGDTGRVLFVAEKKRDEIVMEIHNTGEPINETDAEKFFVPFFTTKPRGTGLGLAICRKLVESHGGQIQLSRSNREGFATMVRIVLKGAAHG